MKNTNLLKSASILFFMLCTFSQVWAATATWSSITKSTSTTQGEITLTLTNFSMSSGYIGCGESSGGSLTIGASSGYVISNVSITYTENAANRVGGSPTVSPNTHYQYSLSSTTGTISLKAGGTAQQSVTFTTTDKCRISAMTVTYNAVVTDSYDIHIGKNNADYTDQSLTNTSGTTWSKTVTLDGGSYYEFKVKKTPSAGEAVWYGNNGSILATTSPAWDFSTSDGNCKLYTTVSGSYMFSWDTSTSKLTVTYPSGSHPTKRVYMACGSTTWCDASPKFYVHSWGVAEYNTEVQLNSCGDYYADIIWYNDYFQFTRNSSSATAYNNNQWNVSQDLTYSSSQTLWTCTGWSDSKGTFSSSAYSATRYSVTITPTNATKLTGTTGANAATCGTEYTATFQRNAGYNLPATVTVTIGGSSATSGTDYTWTQATGTLTIPGTKITGNIEVSLSGTAVICPDGSVAATLFSLSSVGSGYNNTSESETELTDITITGGFAYGYGTSDKALSYSSNKIKYNGGVNYIKLVLDCDLQEGDVISFSCDANTGLNFNSDGSNAGGNTTYTTGALNGSTYSVVADDGLEGENTIYCWRRTGNATNVTALTITRPVTCTAGAPGSIIKGEASGGTGSINLTVSGSPASGDTWYWQTSASGTDKTRSTASAYAVSSPGTYYLRSYNTSSDCWSFTTRSVTVAADDLLTAITPTLSYDDEVEVGGTINPTLTGNSGSGTVTYSLNSVSPAGSLTINASTGAVTGVTAGGTATVTATITANGNYAGGSATSGTITVPDGTCFKITDARKKTMADNRPSGTVITGGTMIEGAITGGTLTYMSRNGGTMSGNSSKGLIFDNANDTLVVELTSGHVFGADGVITITSCGASANTCGFAVSGNSMTPASHTETSAGGGSQSYTITAADGIAGENKLYITRIAASSINTYFYSISITGCEECDIISPTLTAGTTTLYTYPTATSTTLTLDKDGSTGGVTWTSSDASIASVSGSGTSATVTAVAAGSATITATIAADDTYCAKSVTKTFTVKGECGYNVIAGVTLTSASTGSGEGALYSSCNISTESLKDGGYKIGSDKYASLTLSSGNYFQNGDTVVVNLAVKGSGDLYIAAGTTSPGTALGYIANASVSTGNNMLILSNVPASTASITMHRNQYSGSSNSQNHSVKSIKVKRYVCPEGVFEFNDADDDSLWSTEENWVGEAGQTVASLPTTSDRVIVTKPITVDITDAQASEVILDQSSTNTGSLEINAGKELAVAQTVKVWDGSALHATTVNDIVFNSDASNGLGALVMGSHDGTNKATVNFYTLSHGSSGSGASVNQYVGTPFNDENNILHNWYNSWVYGITYDGSGNIGWTRINAGSGMTPFYGYTVISADAAGHSYWQQGTLVASTDQTLSGLNWQSGVGTANGNNENLLANSWMAPIYINAMETTDFVNTDATVYIFKSTSPDDFTSEGFAGNYTTYTVNTSYDDVIPAMQSFSVFTNATGGSSVTLDYSKIVYEPAVAGDAVPEANKAPHRENGTAGEADKLRLYVRAASGYGDMLYLWEQDGLSEGFDNGWDGRKMFGEPVAPQLYADTPDGNMAINCVPDWEGTVLGFRKGTEDNTYTFTFEYEGEQTWYLNDMKEETSTRIMSENSYLFSTADGDSEARFIISATPISKVTTDIGEAGCLPSAVRKMVIDNHVYIIRNGRMYDATGVMMR